MTDYVIPPPAIVAVPVAGGGSFPVRRVFCVGRNYAEHAREMGGDPNREPPFFFMKPADALLTGNADMPYPPASNELHHEMELVVAIGAGGVDIDVVVTDAAADDQLAVFQPLDGGSRQDQIVVEHQRMSIFDLAHQLALVVGIEGDDVGDVAEDSHLRLGEAGDEIGDDDLVALAHGGSAAKKECN